MLIQIKDLITGQFYEVNTNQICYFTKNPNVMGTLRYQIILTNNTIITVPHKRWTKIRHMISSNSI